MILSCRPLSLINSECDSKKYASFSLAAPHRSIPMNCLFDRFVLAPNPPANTVVFLPFTFGPQFCFIRHTISSVYILSASIVYRNAQIVWFMLSRLQPALPLIADSICLKRLYATSYYRIPEASASRALSQNMRSYLSSLLPLSGSPVCSSTKRLLP